MICPYCKNHIQENAKACPYCGVSYVNKTQQPFPTEQLNQQYQQPQQQENKQPIQQPQPQVRQQPVYQQPNTQAPLYNFNMYRQPIQYVQPKKTYYTNLYWASSFMGMIGTLLMAVALFAPFAFESGLISIDKSYFVVFVVIVVIFIFSIPFKPLYTVDVVFRILAAIFGCIFIVYQYTIICSVLRKHGPGDSSFGSYVGAGFYFMTIGSILLFISGCVAIPAINKYKGGRV